MRSPLAGELRILIMGNRSGWRLSTLLTALARRSRKIFSGRDFIRCSRRVVTRRTCYLLLGTNIDIKEEYMTITERIAELREYARQDGERCSESSIADLLAFPSRIAGMDGPYVFMDSGNLPALFRNDKQRFGLDFYGEGKARLIVFFSDRQRKSETSYFYLTGLSTELNEESFLTFV